MLSFSSFKTSGLFKVMLEKHIRDTSVFPCYDGRIQFVTPRCPTQTRSKKEEKKNKHKGRGREKKADKKTPITPPKKESKKYTLYMNTSE